MNQQSDEVGGLAGAFKRRCVHPLFIRGSRGPIRAWHLFAAVMACLMVMACCVGWRLGVDMATRQSPAAALIAAVAVVALGPLFTFALFWAIETQEYEKAQRAAELERRHADLARQNHLLAGDLETARSIQRMFLPDPTRQPFPRLLSFAHVFRPEMAVGGDYYDLKALDDRRVALLLADVSGHGMSAAFITGLIKTTFEFQYSPDQTPPQFMAKVNNVLERLTPTSSFAGVIFAIYDVQSHELRYSNAGHNPAPILVRGATGEVEWLDDWVDLLAGVNPDMKYQEDRLQLVSGDKLFLCTDGITEAVNAAGERFGFTRLYDCLRAHVEQPAPKLLEEVLRSVSAHTGPAKTPGDDQTVLIMEVLN